VENTVRALIAEMAEMPVIDSHEHLPPEQQTISETADVFNRIYCHYSITGAVSAGMKEDRHALKDANIPLATRWEQFRPYRAAMQDTGYARAAQIAARDLYGIDEINDSTYEELSRKLQNANQPGLYDHILKDRCRIDRVLNQGSWHDGKDGYALSVCRSFMGLGGVSPAALKALYDEWQQCHGGDFENACDWVSFWLKELARDGYVGLKFSASMSTDCVSDLEAEAIFKKLLNSPLSPADSRTFGVWLQHCAIRTAPEYALVVAIHCGLVWCCWNEFAPLNPMNIVPLLMKYRDTSFDLYHGGIPWVREMGVIGNQYPNANLNLIWCHQISPYMTEQMLNEWIDLVPTNKIIGFGGDNPFSVEKTYGVLKMTQENLARALAVRLARGQMSESRALEICADWLYNNPKRIYAL